MELGDNILTIRVISSLLNLNGKVSVHQRCTVEMTSNLLVTLPAASLLDPDTADFGAGRATRDVVICSILFFGGQSEFKTKTNQLQHAHADNQVTVSRVPTCYQCGCGEGGTVRHSAYSHHPRSDQPT